MGAIRETVTGRMYPLEPEHVFGRIGPPRCSQTLSDPLVSSVHAVLRWTGRDWELRDLNSTNGTYLGGQRVSDSSSLLVSVGATIGFGQPANQWEIVDSSGPDAMAVPVEGGDPVRAERELIALPSRDDPRATIYKAGKGGWFLEGGEDGPALLHNTKLFHAAGRLWRFCCVERGQPTLGRDHPRAIPLEVGRLDLTFAVSRNEEHVELRAKCGDRCIDLGARNCHYLLLTLARQRLRDAREDFPETSCGWVDVDELGRDPSMAPPRLNIDVYRIRDHFARHGIVDAAKIIERRCRSKQLRIGTGRLSISIL